MICLMCHGAHDEDTACPPVKVESTNSRVFESKYYSRCTECKDKIEPGDNVLFLSDRIYHEECGS